MDEAAISRWLENYQQRFAAFADRLGDRLPPERRRIYERALASSSRLLTRYRSRQHLTIVHGDAHVWNVMCRRPVLDSRPPLAADVGLPVNVAWPRSSSEPSPSAL